MNSSFTVEGHILTLNPHHRLLFFDDEVIKVTPTEYKLLTFILREEMAQDELLASQALGWQGSLTKATRENLEKHIYNLRSKLRPFGLTIFRLRNFGYYFSTCQVQEQQPHHYMQVI